MTKNNFIAEVTFKNIGERSTAVSVEYPSIINTMSTTLNAKLNLGRLGVI